MSNLITLEEETKRIELNLLDSSGISPPGKYYGSTGYNIKEKTDYHQDSREFLGFLLKHRDTFVVTPKIFREICESTRDSGVTSASKYKHRKNKRIIEKGKLFGTIESCISRTKLLIELFEEEGRIIELTDREKRIENYVKKRISSLKEKYNLSEADFELLYEGITLSRNHSPVAIISRDMGVFKAFTESFRIGLFARENLFFCERKEFPYLNVKYPSNKHQRN